MSQLLLRYISIMAPKNDLFTCFKPVFHPRTILGGRTRTVAGIKLIVIVLSITHTKYRQNMLMLRTTM